MWKFDIEFWEFESLNQVIRSGVLRQVKQLAFELHMTIFQRGGISALLYQTTYEMLLELERQGFRKFRSDTNRANIYTNIRTGRRSPGRFEMYYINLKFLKQEENNLSSKMYNIWCPTIHISHIFIAGYHLKFECNNILLSNLIYFNVNKHPRFCISFHYISVHTFMFVYMY